MQALQLVIELDDKGAISKVATLDANFAKFTSGMGAKAATAASAMDRISSGAQAVSNSLRGLSLIGGVSLTALAGKMVYAGAQFEQSMANTQAASRATTVELAGLDTMARKYSQGTVFSAHEIADAMASLAKEGMNVGEIKDVIPKALLFAGASGISLNETIQMLDSTMRAFGISAADSGKLVLTLTGAMSVTPIEPLIEALQLAGPAASGFGVNLQDLITDFALLEKSGIAGTRAGTGFQMMLERLAVPSKEISVMLGNMRFTGDNLTQVLNKIRTSGASTSEVLSAFGAGLRGAGPVVINLMKQTAEQVEHVKTALGDTSAAQTMYNERMATTESKIKMLKNTIENDLIAVFDTLKLALGGVLDALKTTFDPNGEVVQGIRAQAAGFADWTKAHQDLVATVVTQGPKVLLFLMGLQLLSGAITTGTVLYGALGSILAALGSPLVGIGIAATGAAYGVDELTKNTRDMNRAFQGFRPGMDFIPSMETVKETVTDSLGLLDQLIAKMTYLQKPGITPPVTIPGGPERGSVPKAGKSTIVPEIPGGTLARLMPPGAMTGDMTPPGGWSHYIENARNAAKEAAMAQKVAFEGEILSEATDTQAWLQAKIGFANAEMAEEVANAKGSSAAIMEAKLKNEEAVHKAQMEYADAVLEKYRLVFSTLQAGYDTMIESSLDKEMTGKQRREAIWASMKQAFLKMTADMLKQWIIDEARKIIIQRASQATATTIMIGETIAQQLAVAHLAAAEAFAAYAGIPFIGQAMGMAAAGVAFGTALALHAGGIIRDDERIIKVQTGEGVLQRSAMLGIGEANFDYMNATGRFPTASGRVSPGGGASIGPFIFQISASDKEIANSLSGFIEEKIIPALETAIVRRKFSLVGEM